MRGSAPGERRGGRQRGTPNKATVERTILAKAGLEAVRLTGVTPLDVILTVALGKPEAAQITDRQLQAAIAAAPYIHAKLAAVAVQDVTPPDPVLEAERAAVRQKYLAHLDALARPEPLSQQQLQIAKTFTANTDRQLPIRNRPPPPKYW